MLRSRIFLFVLLNVLHRFNCLQRSDWTYDRESDVVTLTTNGTTYSCRSSDITGPLQKRSTMDSISRATMNDVESVDDPECISERISGDFLPTFAHQMSADLSQGKGSCNVPLPTVEETLERVEKVYLSSSYNDRDVVDWFDQVKQNLTQLSAMQTGNVSRREQRVDLGKVYAQACGVSVSAWTLSRMREEVSDAQVALESAKEEEEKIKSAISANYSDAVERRERELLLELEVQALKDSRECELETWHKLAESRFRLIEMTSLKKEMERQATEASLRVGEAKMKVFLKMGTANSLLAWIEAKMRNVTDSINKSW